MSAIALATVLALNTFYPSAGDRPQVLPKSVEASPRVEVARDNGLIVELTVRCSTGFTIIAYSKTEKLYCRPRGGCSRDFASTVAQSCRGE